MGVLDQRASRILETFFFFGHSGSFHNDFKNLNLHAHFFSHIKELEENLILFSLIIVLICSGYSDKLPWTG